MESNHHVEAPSLRAVSYGDGLFVAVGENWRDSDLDEWQRVGAQDIRQQTNNLLAVTYGNGRFVVVGRNAPLITANTLNDTILVSLDGAKWSLIDLEHQLVTLSVCKPSRMVTACLSRAGDDGIVDFARWDKLGEAGLADL